MFRRSTMVWLAVLAFGLFFALAACVVILPRLLYPPLSAVELRSVEDQRERIELQQAQGELENNVRAPMLQGLGGIIVAVGLIATWQQVKNSREGQITDRFTHAIDQIGSEKPEVRVGGIRALERIARNSKEDRPTIAYVLGAFVRIHAPWQEGSAETPAHANSEVDVQLPWLEQRAPDVQTAMWVLGSRSPTKEPVPLYLSRVDLRSAHLAEARLSNTQLRRANLARTWMPGVDLTRSDLESADLRQANLHGARLREANLRGANLQGAWLEGADLTDVRADARTSWPEGIDADHLRKLGVLVDDGPTTTDASRGDDESPAGR